MLHKNGLLNSDVLTTRGIVKTLCDPACGTGGMLSVAEDYVRELNPDARLEVFGQDYHAQAYAICGSDMMIKGQDIEHIAYGDSFTDDRFPHHRFDYMLANPPFGVEWKPEANFIKREHDEQDFNGRFGGRSAAHQRWLAAVFAAHDQQDEAPGRRGHTPGHRLQRFPPVHRRRRIG